MNCMLCPVGCNADRKQISGRCGTKGLRIAKFGLHFYEEPCISFEKGSGAIFFCGCALRCRFCQNFELSRNLRGREITPAELADIFRALEDMGAENVNLINPSHLLPLIKEAFGLYRPRIPVVYNSHGYEKTDALESIAPFVDIWLPDLKFFSPKISARYTGREDYFPYAIKAVEFMAKKPLLFDERGKMLSGTVVRHLILPLCTDDSIAIVDRLAPIKDNIYLSLMRQYTPFGDIADLPELQRKITAREYKKVLQHTLALEFPHLFLQDKESADTSYIPVWDD